MINYSEAINTIKINRELTDEFTSACCRGHTRMASGLYNKVRWTLDHRYND